jgi:hypothetical protein
VRHHLILTVTKQTSSKSSSNDFLDGMQTSFYWLIRSSYQRRHATSDKKRLRQGNRFAVVCKVSFHFLESALSPNSENKFVLRYTHFL